MYDYSTDLIGLLLARFSAFFGVTVTLQDLLLCVALVAAVGFLFKKLQKRRLTRHFAERQRNVVTELLNSAIEQRSVMELEFSAEDLHGHGHTGPCSHVSEHDFTIDVDLEHSLQTWIGEMVDVSFKLTHKGIDAYYRFPSKVLKMNAGARVVSVVLALPDFIHPMQKRSYVRIAPTPDHVLGMGFWSLDPARPLPQDSTTLGQAALSYHPGKAAQCVLLNLSAGGLRATVPQPLLQQFPHGLTLRSSILCLLLLRAPDTRQPMPFWLSGTVVSLFEDSEQPPTVVLGLKFKAWALSETGDSNIFWFPAGKTGEVSPLASWVLQHQLRQNKKRT